MKYWLILFTIGLFGCDQQNAWDCIQTIGDIIEEPIPITRTIKRIVIFDDTNLVWHPPNAPGEQAFVIETGENLINEIETTIIADSILEVKNSNHCRWTRAPRNLTLHVFSDSINWIEKQGFGEINTTELITLNHRLDVITLGSGNMNLKLLNPNEVWLSMRALSNVTISGEVATLHVFVDQRVDGRLYAEDLTVRDVSIWHGGSNDLFVGPSDILRGTIRGSGDVFLFREPDRGVVVNEDGSGRVINRF